VSHQNACVTMADFRWRRRAITLALALFASGCTKSIYVPAVGLGDRISATSNSLTFDTLGESQTVTLSQADGNTTFSASGCASIVATEFAGPAVTVTAIGTGTCTLTIFGAHSSRATIGISVTTTAQ